MCLPLDEKSLLWFPESVVEDAVLHSFGLDHHTVSRGVATCIEDITVLAQRSKKPPLAVGGCAAGVVEPAYIRLKWCLLKRHL